MAKSKTLHSIETLHALCEECGDCWEWGRYYANSVPYVFQGGRMMSVRKLMMELTGGIRGTKKLQFGTSCGNAKCVNPEHVVGRTAEQHARHMGRLGGGEIKAAKIQKSWAGRTKLTREQVQEIRLSDETLAVLAARYGVSKTYIGKIKRGVVWRQYGGMWAGLF